MKDLNDKMAKNCAVEYVKRTKMIFNTNGCFNTYFVRVGEDLTHQPDTIYIENLRKSDLEIMTSSEAKKIFYEECDANNEYLVRVSYNIVSRELNPDILVRSINCRKKI